MAQVLGTLIGSMEKSDLLVGGIAEHHIHTLHRGSGFFKGVFCVGGLFGTCVRCHAARGRCVRFTKKIYLGLQVKQNATNTWRHS